MLDPIPMVRDTYPVSKVDTIPRAGPIPTVNTIPNDHNTPYPYTL